jgi:hypothetical protein
MFIGGFSPVYGAGMSPYAYNPYTAMGSPATGFSPYGGGFGYNPYAAMGSPFMGGGMGGSLPPGYNPYGISFPYGGNIPANDYAQQSMSASAAIRSAQQITPGPSSELLGIMDKLGQAFPPNRLSTDPGFNYALDQLTGIPGGIPGFGPAGSAFPNFPLTNLNNDPRRFQFAPQNFPYAAYNNPLVPSGFGSSPRLMPQPLITLNPFGFGGFNPYVGGYGMQPIYPVLYNPFVPSFGGRFG